MDYLESKGGGDIEKAVVDGICVTAGFVGSGLLGSEIEKRVKKDITESSPLTDKLMAYGVNNLPKVVTYLLVDMLGTGHEIDVAKLGITGNIMTDTLVRASNNGVNTGKLFGYNFLSNRVERTSGAGAGVRSSDVQRLIQENSGLRTELNKALQRLAAQPRGQIGQIAGQVAGGQRQQAAPIVYVQPVQQVPNPLQVPNQQAMQAQQAQMQSQQTQARAAAQAHAQQAQAAQMQAQVRAQAAQSARTQAQARPVQVQPIQVQPVIRAQVPPVIAQQPIIQERERKFGFMGEEEDRRRKYGSMPTYDAPAPVKGRERKYGFMEQEKEIAAAFGML